jgi:hypothetical protein
MLILVDDLVENSLYTKDFIYQRINKKLMKRHVYGENGDLRLKTNGKSSIFCKSVFKSLVSAYSTTAAY